MLDENGNDQIVGFDISLAYQIAEDLSLIHIYHPKTE